MQEQHSAPWLIGRRYGRCMEDKSAGTAIANRSRGALERAPKAWLAEAGGSPVRFLAEPGNLRSFTFLAYLLGAASFYGMVSEH